MQTISAKLQIKQERIIQETILEFWLFAQYLDIPILEKLMYQSCIKAKNIELKDLDNS